MLMQLIRKDLCITRLPILVGITAMIGAFALSYAIYVSTTQSQEEGTEVWGFVLKTGSVLSSVTSLFALTMMSGTIIAAERADRSAEFLACLPPSRGQVLLSKAIVLGASSLLALCVSGGGVLLASQLGGDNSAFKLSLLDVLPIALVSIGVGWCGSALFANTGPSVGFGFVAPILVTSGVFLFKFCFGVPSYESFHSVYLACCSVAGIVCIIIGTFYFIRRVEP